MIEVVIHRKDGSVKRRPISLIANAYAFVRLAEKDTWRAVYILEPPYAARKVHDSEWPLGDNLIAKRTPAKPAHD